MRKTMLALFLMVGGCDRGKPLPECQPDMVFVYPNQPDMARPLLQPWVIDDGGVPGPLPDLGDCGGIYGHCCAYEAGDLYCHKGLTCDEATDSCQHMDMVF